MQHTDAHDDIGRDCYNAVDEHQQTNDRRRYQPVCVVTKPCKVQSDLLTEIHSSSDTNVYISTKLNNNSDAIYITHTGRSCLQAPKVTQHKLANVPKCLSLGVKLVPKCHLMHYSAPVFKTINFKCGLKV